MGLYCEDFRHVFNLQVPCCSSCHDEFEDSLYSPEIIDIGEDIYHVCCKLEQEYLKTIEDAKKEQ